MTMSVGRMLEEAAACAAVGCWFDIVLFASALFPADATTPFVEAAPGVAV